MKSFKFQNLDIFYSISHYLDFFGGFKFLAIGAAEADAGIYSSRSFFLKTVIP